MLFYVCGSKLTLAPLSFPNYIFIYLFKIIIIIKIA